MERKLMALAIVLGVAFGAGMPAIIGMLSSATTLEPAKAPMVEKAGPVEAPKAALAPPSEHTARETLQEAGPQPGQYILAIALPAIIALLAFVAFNVLLKKG